ncbi:DeSI-like protein [Glycine soja]|uniref:DeSI-like protein n=2 Tax=Magnoliopsida TaxID=3398 RepID=A0A445J0J9_GLYSO|nr:DeSI-like protein [Glycine soja]
MTDVVLHIYDVTNSGSEKTNSTIVQINKIFKDGIGLGGIFHSAVQVFGDDEWSFGFCEQGTGVFSCPSGKNPMYTYRESIVLGKTNFSIFKLNQILRELSREWPGSSYDLLSKNCNHFCDEFCERLGVPKLPGPRNWLFQSNSVMGLRFGARVRGAAYLVRVAAAVVVLETGVRRRRRQTCRHRTGARVVPLEFTCFCLCSRSLSPFACENRVRVGSGRPNTTRCENFKKKKLSSAITAIPQQPLWLWRPPWRRHTKPATPPLFGGVFSKTCDTIPPWRHHNHFLTTLTCWVNRFANAGDTAMEVAGNTALRFRQAKTEIVSASKVAYRFLLGVTNNVTNNVKNGPETPNNSNRGGSPRLQGSWLKNIITNGAKPSTSSEAENQNGVMPLPPTREDDQALLHSSS